MKKLSFAWFITMLCLITATLFIAFGCDKSKIAPAENYPIKISFLEYSLAKTSCQWTSFEANKVIIINSDEELSGYIVCADEDYPKIDFSKHSVLLARGWSTYGIHYIDIDFLKETANEYALYVSIHTYTTAEASPWIASIITPKMNSENKILLNVQQIND